MNALSNLITELVEDLHAPLSGLRLAAAQALAEEGAAGMPAADALRQVAKDDEDAGVRLAATVALGRIEGRPESVVPLLIDVLEDEFDPARRWLAADALRDLGAAARPALPALWRVRRRPVERPAVRESIRLALNRLRTGV